MRTTYMEVSRVQDVASGRPINTCSAEDEATITKLVSAMSVAMQCIQLLALACSCALLLYFHLLRVGKYAFMFTFAILL